MSNQAVDIVTCHFQQNTTIFFRGGGIFGCFYREKYVKQPCRFYIVHCYSCPKKINLQTSTVPFKLLVQNTSIK